MPGLRTIEAMFGAVQAAPHRVVRHGVEQIGGAVRLGRRVAEPVLDIAGIGRSSVATASIKAHPPIAADLQKVELPGLTAGDEYTLRAGAFAVGKRVPVRIPHTGTYRITESTPTALEARIDGKLGALPVNGSIRIEQVGDDQAQVARNLSIGGRSASEVVDYNIVNSRRNMLAMQRADGESPVDELIMIEPDGTVTFSNTSAMDGLLGGSLVSGTLVPRKLVHTP